MFDAEKFLKELSKLGITCIRQKTNILRAARIANGESVTPPPEPGMLLRSHHGLRMVVSIEGGLRLLAMDGKELGRTIGDSWIAKEGLEEYITRRHYEFVGQVRDAVLRTY